MKKMIWIVMFLSLLLLTAGAGAEEEWRYLVEEDQTVTLTAYLGNETDVTIPKEIEGCPVVKLASGAFQESVRLISLSALITDLPEGAIPASTVIRAPHGSAALRYAEQHGLSFVNTSKLDFAEEVIDMTGAMVHDLQKGNRFFLPKMYSRILSEGSLFYLPDNGMGCVYEVQSIAEQEGQIILDTRQASADRSYNTFHVRMENLSPDYAHMTKLSPLVTNVRYDPIQNDTSLTMENGGVRLRSRAATPVLASKVVDFDLTLPLGKASKASLGISLTLSLQEFEVKFTKHFGKIDHAKMLVNASTSVELSASTDASWGDDDGMESLLDLEGNLLGGNALSLLQSSGEGETSVELLRIPFMTTGGFTLSVVPRLTIGIDGQISVSIDSSVDAGFLYDGEWHNLCQVNEPELNTEVAAGFSAGFDLSFTASLPMVPDVAELALTLIEVEGKAKAASTTTTNATRACIDLSLEGRSKITVGIGLKNAIAKYKKWLKSNMEVPDLWLSFTLMNRKIFSKQLHYEPLLGVVDKCTKGGVKVIFDANGGEGGTEVFAIPGTVYAAFNSADAAAFPSVTREGYVLDEWLDENGDTIKSFTVETEERHLYAKWKEAEPGQEPAAPSLHASTYHDVINYGAAEGRVDENGVEHIIEHLVSVEVNMSEPAPYYLSKISNSYRDDQGYDENGKHVVNIFVAAEDPEKGKKYIYPNVNFLVSAVLWMRTNNETLHLCGVNGDHLSDLTSIHYSSDFLRTEGHSYCPNLRTVTFENGIEDIGMYTECTSLQSIVIPDSVTWLRPMVFGGCKSLTSIKLPNGITAIPNGAFMDCASLTNIVIPDSVKTIKNDMSGGSGDDCTVFRGCTSLKSVTLPASLEALPYDAFDGCSALEEVTLPAGIGYLPRFMGCTSLKRIHIISQSQMFNSITLDFSNVPALEEVDFSAQKIVISNVSALTSCSTVSLHASDSITISGSRYYGNGPAVINLTAGNSISMTGCISNLRELNTTAKQQYINISTNADTLTVYDQVTDIENSRVEFKDSPNLTMLYIQNFAGDTANWNGPSVSNCPALTEIRIADARGISGTFTQCPALKTVTVEHMTGDFINCFNQSPAIETLIIMDGCTAVTQPFEDKTSALRIVVPESVQNIDLGKPSDYPNRLVLEAPEGSPAALQCPEFLLGPYQLAFRSEYGMEYETRKGLAAGTKITIPDRNDMSSVQQGLQVWNYELYTDPNYAAAATLDEQGCFVMPAHDVTIYVKWGLEQPWGEAWEYGTFETADGAESGNILKSVGALAIYKLNEYNPCECLGTDVFGDTVETVIIPASMRGVQAGAFRSAVDLRKIVVMAGHPTLYSMGGALYDRNDTLLAVPHKLDTYEFEIPDGTKGIADYAFGWVECPSDLRAVIVPDSVVSVGAHAFDGLSADTMIICSRTSPAYSAAASASLLAHPSSVVYMVGNECWSYYMLPAGTALPQVEAPQIAGEVFKGWSTARQGSVIGENYLVPEGGIVLYAIWQGDGIPVNEDYFPDPAFRSYVSENFDWDQNGSLSEEERNGAGMVRVGVPDEWIEEGNCTAEEAAYIREHYQGSITSLKGIEYLTGLKWLHAAEMTALSGALNVSANQQLESIVVFNSGLSGLILGNHPSLDNIHAEDNPLTSLDVSGCPALRDIHCMNAGLTSLDVSHNTNLEELWLYSNRLTEIDVSACTALKTLSVSNNAFTALNMGTNTSLKELYCDGNQLTMLDVSGLTNLEILGCDTNRLTSLDVHLNTKLRELYCYRNRLTSLDAHMLTDLVRLECSFMDTFTSLNVRGLNKLEVLYLGRDSLTSVDLTGLSSLVELEVWGNNLSSLDLSGLDSLEYLTCNNNRLTQLNTSQNSSLSLLYAYENSLTSVTLNPGIDAVSIFGNPLTALNISACPKLVSAYQNGELDDQDEYIGYVYERTADDVYWLFYPKETVLLTGEGSAAYLLLPAVLREIEAEAFAGIAADIVVVPAGCTSIGSRAFADCPNLKTVYIPSSASIAADAFEGCENVEIIRTE